MPQINYKKIFVYSLIIVSVFIIDRLTKLYIFDLVEVSNTNGIYVFEFLNLYLIWNKGIAFGLFSSDQTFVYNFVTLLIILIDIILLIIIIKIQNYKVYFFLLIVGGSLGNLFDRIYYSAVPDFIDFHIKSFNWFVFNVADIFITFGVLCLIIVEIFFNKNRKKNNI